MKDSRHTGRVLGLLVSYLLKDLRHAESVLDKLVCYMKDSRHAGSILGLLCTT